MSEDLSEDSATSVDGADGLEHLSDMEDSEDDYGNLTMDDESQNFEVTKELRKFTVDEFKFTEGEPSPKSGIFKGDPVGGVLPFPRDDRGNASVTALGAFELATYFPVRSHRQVFQGVRQALVRLAEHHSEGDACVARAVVHQLVIVHLPAMEDYWDKGEVRAPN